MTEQTPDDLVDAPDELTTLKARADLMGISYHPSIGLEKLRDKVNAATTSDEKLEEEEAPAQDGAQEVETEKQFHARLRRESNELIRVRVSCMNPEKKEWDGEIFTTGNSVVGTISKFVPFNNEEGWHIPRMIYQQMIQRQCQIWTSERDNRGNSIRKSKMIKEFAIEILPNLTIDELQELARRQALGKNID